MAVEYKILPDKYTRWRKFATFAENFRVLQTSIIAFM